jgi:hypothetical protein
MIKAQGRALHFPELNNRVYDELRNNIPAVDALEDKKFPPRSADGIEQVTGKVHADL